MTRNAALLITCLLWLSAIVCAQSPPPDSAGASSLRVSSVDEVGAEFDSVPCKNKDRLTAVKALFEKMGANSDDITVEKFGVAENVIVKIAGTASQAAEKIVIGAHFDKTPDGCGAIDNWSGIVSIAHIYRTMRSLKSNRTLIFVGFGEEEKGLVGSKAMVDKIKKEQVGEYCAMINIDSLGVAIPQVADNMSSKKLIEATSEIAKQMSMQFAHADIPNAGGDSMSFMVKKIPAITIHGLTSDWPKILHSSNDKPEKVNRQSVYLGYRLGLALLVKVDESPCDAFREIKEDKNGKGGKGK